MASLALASMTAALLVAQTPSSSGIPSAYPTTQQLGYPAGPTTTPILPAVDPDAPTTPIPDVETSPEDVSFFTPFYNSMDYWFGPTPWDTSMEVGINGTQGTNDALSVRAGGNVSRKTEFNKIDIDIEYNKASANNVETQNNAQFDARHDWLYDESPWTLFAATSVLYDEFQAFDLRFAANGGVGFQFIDTETTTFASRFGAGTSREFGGPDDRWVPEALFGLEIDHDINKRQKVYGKIDYFPDWGNFASYRAVADVGWEILLDEDTDISLKLSITDRYDSTPNGADPNLLNYSVLLLWKL